MAKTNFTKVEDMLNQGLQKINVEHLLEEADAAKGIAPKQTEQEKRAFIASIQRDLKLIQKNDRDSITKLGLKKKFFKKIIETPEALSPEEMETLKQIQEKIKVFKEELKNKLPPINDESIVETERTKHINKRYNVNDKWLPLK